jgi:uncharacterized OB-fold protein
MADPAPYFAAAARGVLALQRCDACSAFAFPVRARCARCGSTRLGWRDASGLGRVFAHGRARRATLPEHEGHLPLTLLLVDLDEGVRIPARLAAGEREGIAAGDRVAVGFESAADGTALPVCRRAR